MENILTFTGSSCMALFGHYVIHTKQIYLYNIQIFQRSKITDKVLPEPRSIPMYQETHQRWWSTLFTALYFVRPMLIFSVSFHNPFLSQMCQNDRVHGSTGARWHRTHQSHQCMTLITRPPVWHNGEKVDMQKTFIIHPTFSNLKLFYIPSFYSSAHFSEACPIISF